MQPENERQIISIDQSGLAKVTGPQGDSFAGRLQQIERLLLQVEAAEEDLATTNGALQHSQSTIRLEINCTPGQVPSLSDLSPEIKNIELMLRYTQGHSPFELGRREIEGYGMVPHRYERPVTDEPFSVEISISDISRTGADALRQALSSRSGFAAIRDALHSNAGKMRFHAADDDVRRDPKVAIEFREVLEAAYYDHLDDRINFSVDEVPMHHNSDVFTNGITLHFDGALKLSVHEKFEIFEKALANYFSVKGYQLSTFSVAEAQESELTKTRLRESQVQHTLEQLRIELERVNPANLNMNDIVYLREFSLSFVAILETYTRLRKNVSSDEDVQLDPIESVLSNLPTEEPSALLADLAAYARGAVKAYSKNDGVLFKKKLVALSRELLDLAARI